MFNFIIHWSLQNRLLILALTVLLTIYGTLVASRLPVDVFPDLNRPTVTIMSEAHGLAPEEVETLVTLPLETAMNGAAGVVRVRSASSIGFSIVWVEFDWDVDTYTARQIVSEKMQQVTSALPEDVYSQMGPVSSIMGEIMLIGLTGGEGMVDPMELRSIADWQVRQRLLAIPGVSQVTVIGGERKQYQVLVDPGRLRYHQVPLQKVVEALENANVNSTGGFLLEKHQEHLIRNIGRVRSVEDLERSVIPVKPGPGAPALTIEQVAGVQTGGPLAKRGDASISGQSGVILSVQKQPGADTVELTRKIEAELDTIRRSLPESVQIHDDLFRQSVFIERAIDNIVEALRDGSFLVAVVLFLFLLNFRTTIITLTAIPLSFLVTALVFDWLGMSINTMTLGGLAVAIGELVDDAIVGVENVFRRLRENRQRAKPLPPLDVIRDATSEIRNSIVFATLVVVLVFVPLFAMSGIEGRIFTPLGIAYIVSIIASLMVSLTVTPVLSYYLLPGMRRLKDERDGWFVRALKRAEKSVLTFLAPRPSGVFFLTFVLFAGSAATLPFLGKEFLPEFNEGSVTISMVMAPGTSLEESNRLAGIAEKLLLEIPEVQKTGRRTGRGELDEHAMGVNASEIEVELHDQGRSREAVLHDMRQALGSLPGAVINIGQPISHRIDHMISGVRAQIAIKLFGEDLTVLRSKAEEIRQAVSQVEGVVDLQVEKQVLIPQLHIRLDREEAKKHGVMVGELAEHAELALQGRKVTEIVDGRRIHDVVLRLNDEARNDVASIGEMPVTTLRGNIVPLGWVADVDLAKGPNIINRENVSRRIVIQANVAERDLVSVVGEIQRIVDEDVSLPSGYFLTYGGQFETQQSAAQAVLLLSLVSLAGMFLVIYGHFRSTSLTLQVMLAIPLALVGSVAGVWLSGGVFSIATMVGFITLTGIAARNGILMISHYLHLMKHEGEKFDFEMILRGTQERLVPVLMTALTAMLALTPLILAEGEPGKEILHPVAVVIFSGLFSSTLLNLIVTPLLFWKFSGTSIQRLVPDAVPSESR
ncbi:efflux RND transporter permease subunit [Tepidicaulis sp. LMO-SS28]|uniref:efflux RND transporter permease subunit n=1 Tax=Tepidicaulis sp. LMO-SS28 TaxID=3447455 RepID=UPI003EE34402